MPKAAQQQPQGQEEEVETMQADPEEQLQQFLVPQMKEMTLDIDSGHPDVPCCMVRVEVDLSGRTPLPFLGGYRRRASGATFLHATTQTPSTPAQLAAAAAAAAAPPKLCREVQTLDVSSRSAQTVRENGTQMRRRGLHLDESRDRVLAPRPYVTAATVMQRREAAALTIQRYVRGGHARARAHALRVHKAARDTFLAERAAAAEQDAEDARRHELQRRLHPRQGADFRLLVSEVEAWRAQELGRIDEARRPEEDRRAALRLLLEKETRLLQAIDRLRVNARHEGRGTRERGQLAAMGTPKTWELRNGVRVQVHTPATLRAKELQQLYGGLTLQGLQLDDRLDVLLHVKAAVREFDCGLTREILSLIDREADTLNRQRSEGTLAGLRKRLAARFLAFCQSPDFNPEAARFTLAANATEVFKHARVEMETARVRFLDVSTVVCAC